ncbi:MAG: nucleoside deaminase [Bacteroidales bacterium]|nr:nucleoside deaminase [Bacteroidales bacterium]
MYNKEFMMKAIDLSDDCLETGRGGPFGVVIVKDGKIVGKGSNHVTIDNDPTAHAEIVAIRAACKTLNTFHLEGCEIYTSCEPCPMCFGAIYWARISKIYYAADRYDAEKAGFDDSFIYKEFDLSEDRRSIPVEQHDREEAIKVFGEWKASTNKIEY